MVRWIIETKSALQSGVDDAFLELKSVWKSFHDSFVLSMMPFVEGVNNNTVAYVLNPENYKKDEQGAIVIALISSELANKCWDCLIGEGVAHEAHKLEAQAQRLVESDDDDDEEEEWRQSHAQQMVDAACKTLRKLIRKRAKMILDGTLLNC